MLIFDSDMNIHKLENGLDEHRTSRWSGLNTYANTRKLIIGPTFEYDKIEQLYPWKFNYKDIFKG